MQKASEGSGDDERTARRLLHRDKSQAIVVGAALAAIALTTRNNERRAWNGARPGVPRRAAGRGIALVAALLCSAAIAQPRSPDPIRYGFGKPATREEIAAWDIDVRPDGTGLPPGRGTVEQGQALYDAQCASCHGTFGESTDYMPLAGGVGTLGTDQPIRTTGSKLNHATTLWDYINRAMPFANPKSLAPDEVYALTAYVLHLNDILPADGSLDRESIVRLKMPNRDGFTSDHGLGSVRATPDTRNVACMTNCVREVRLSSQMPEHARNDHGNLAEQTRPLGQGTKRNVAVAGAKVVVGGESKKLADAGTRAELAKSTGCTACHGTTSKLVGPAFREIGGRYAGDSAAAERLAQRVRQGSTGAWGAIPMPPQTQLSEADARALVRWILEGAR
jgi:cytochrome c551/c552